MSLIGCVPTSKRWPRAKFSLGGAVAQLGEHYVRNVGVEGSNPFCSTIQSLAYRTFQRIARNPRVCARFAFACGSRERRRGRKSAKFRESSLRAISLCPTPCDRRRADWWVGAFRRRTFALLSATKGARIRFPSGRVRAMCAEDDRNAQVAAREGESR